LSASPTATTETGISFPSLFETLLDLLVDVANNLSQDVFVPGPSVLQEKLFIGIVVI
jgi:hypothetical protein